jgi:hypothetical protein
MMNDEDLLVTNGFYATTTLTQTNNSDKPGMIYNYYRPNELPYKMENLGPFPDVELRTEKLYDVRTTNDFKKYLKKKERISDDKSNLPDNPLKPMPTSISEGGMGGIGGGGTSFVKKDYGNDLLKVANVDDTLDESSQGSRVVRDTAYMIHIDSRNRDGRGINKTPSGYSYTDLYHSYSYQITLPKPIRNVKMVEIKSSEIPFSVSSTYPYIILSINAITVQQDTYNPNYKPDPSNPYYPDPSTIPPTGVVPYSNIYLNNILNAGKIIQNPPNTSNPDIPVFFTKIQLDGSVGSTLFNKHINFTSVYTNAVQEVYTLAVNFLNPDGSQYQVGDHSFTLELIAYTDSTSFTDISTRRGASDVTIFSKILK